MSFETLTPEQFDTLKKEIEKKLPLRKIEPVKAVKSAVISISAASVGLFDNVFLLIVAIIYFFFTGLALVCGRTLPKEWLAIGTALNKGKIAKKISPPLAPVQATEKPVPSKPKFKVVDLETRKSLN